jgi:hypothetical protein
MNFTFTPIRISRNAVWEKLISPLPLAEGQTCETHKLSKKQFCHRSALDRKTLSHFDAVGKAYSP